MRNKTYTLPKKGHGMRVSLDARMLVAFFPVQVRGSLRKTNEILKVSTACDGRAFHPGGSSQ